LLVLTQVPDVHTTAAPPGSTDPLAPTASTTTRVSIASDGTEGNARSDWPSISADGCYVAFHSVASNLVSGDTNGAMDIFIHDRQMGQTTRVSVASDGTQGNDTSSRPSISADGRYVAFESGASNLVSGDSNNKFDVFVHDRQMGQTTRVSVASDGTQGNSDSAQASISADGRYVAFNSSASNLVSGDTNSERDVFVHDRQTGQTTRVSVASAGTQGNGRPEHLSISPNGWHAAFESYASNLVSGDTNGDKDIFVHDRQTGQTTRVSVASDGTQGNRGSWYPSISVDGRYVAFESWASNLVSGDTNGYGDMFVHDRETRETIRVSVASDGSQGNERSEDASISADGRYVAFGSAASNLVSGDTNGAYDMFVRDRQTGQTTRVSVASDGTEGNYGSHQSSISADGHYVAFHSVASNLVSGDTNGTWDVFVHDRGGVGPSLQLPFSPADQAGPCAFSPNALDCISSLFDHEYPLLPPSLGGSEPITPGIGDTIMIFTGDKHYTGCTLPSASDYGYSGHDACDFRLQFGSPLLADAPGTVTVIPSHLWGGLVIEIDHGNGYKSAYWHLSRVAEGIYTGVQITQADVESKRVIGYSGTAGTGAHLHFAVYFDGKQVDPFGWTGRFEDPWVADYGGPESHCLWSFACSTPTWATPTSSASLTSPDGSIAVSVPAGAVTGTTLLKLTLTPDPITKSSVVPAGYSFDLSAQDMYGKAVETFLQPLTIVINYAENIVNYMLEASLSLHFWDSGAQAWQALPTILDLDNNTATATVDHLSLFALLGEPLNGVPTITSVSPNSGYSHVDTEVAIEGTGFLPVPSARLGIGELAVTFVDSTTLTVAVPSGLSSGVYTLTIINPDTQQGSLESAFTALRPHSIYLPMVLRSYP